MISQSLLNWGKKDFVYTVHKLLEFFSQWFLFLIQSDNRHQKPARSECLIFGLFSFTQSHALVGKTGTEADTYCCWSCLFYERSVLSILIFSSMFWDQNNPILFISKNFPLFFFEDMVVIALPIPSFFAAPFSHVVQVWMLFSRGESIILDRATPGRTSLSILFCPNNGFGLALLCSLRRSMVRKLQVSTSSSYRRKVSPNTIHAKVAPIFAKYSIISINSIGAINL